MFSVSYMLYSEEKVVTETEVRISKGLTNLIHIALPRVLGDVNASSQEGERGSKLETSYLKASGQRRACIYSRVRLRTIGVV
jgi:hypothetical protein